MQTIRLATRGSPLALAQTTLVAEALSASGCTAKPVVIESRGDRDRSTPLRDTGGQGVFTAAINQAVLDGKADAAVHSAKDLPTQLEAGLAIIAIPERACPDDMLIFPPGTDLPPAATALTMLPQGARIGTGSPRRRAQLLHARQNLVMIDIRGNVDTRIEKMQVLHLHAIILAEAGLARLNRTEIPRISLAEVLLPAAGQGAIALVTRTDSNAAGELAKLSHPPSHACVLAERAFLRTLQVGCHAPVGVRTAITHGDELRLLGAAFSPAGERLARVELSGASEMPEALGDEAARQMLSFVPDIASL